MTRHTRQRRGITSVMAMLFLVLFATLAIGFFASVTTTVQVAKNDVHTAKALLAAESGLQFMRYQLAHVEIPPNTAQANVLTELYNDLKANLEGTANFTGMTVTLQNNIISIPSESGKYVVVDSTDKLGFTASITEWGGNIVCKIIGRDGNNSSTASKGVSLDFTRQSLPTTAFNYAIASKGRVSMIKGTLSGVSGISSDSIATVMSATGTSPALSISGGTIGGDLQVTNSGLASVTGGTVGGTSNASLILSQHTHVVDAPDFPVVDTAVFKPYAVNTYSSGSTLTNIRIPAGTNPSFAGGATIQGVLYIESPNTITFRGSVYVNGFIVFENAGDSTQNIIDMRGNFLSGSVPAGAQYDALRATTGIAILGPTAAMTMSGSVDSSVRGNVILGSFNNAGSADLTIDQGTLMTLNTTGTASTFNGKTVKFKSTGQNNQPSQGLVYSQKYIPVGGSYKELD